jgi:hypothetical protein
MVMSGLATPTAGNGYVEGKVGYELDSLSEGTGKLIHLERFSWGVRGGSGKYDYSLRLGGVLRGNTGNSYTSATPEYGVQTNFRPSARFDMALFSYLRLRNPMQVSTDSLEYREFVHGVKLKAIISQSTSLSVSTGLKSSKLSYRDTVNVSQQFVSLKLNQKIGGMQFRLSGETDTWDRDDRDGRSTGLASIHWYGTPFSKMNWTGTNTYFQSDAKNYWRMSHMLRYTYSPRHKVWANFQHGDFAYDSKHLLRQNFDIRYRFALNKILGLDLLMKGNRVGILDSLDIYHWRMYALSSHWRTSGLNYVRGNLDMGFKESYRYGRGLDLQINLSESVDLLRSKRFRLSVLDDVSTEFFKRLDDEDDLRYDFQHKLRITTEFSTTRSIRYGNHLKIHNHLGSDLDFSADTLRNAVIDEIYFKSRGQKTHLAFYYRTVLALLEPENDLHFNLNSRIYHQFSPELNFSLWNNYRFGSDIYSDHLWLNATLKFQTNRASYAVEIQNFGPPESLSKQGSSVWFRFMRHI